MKIFISWSGKDSEKLGLELRNWIRLFFQNVKPFLSSDDIRDGARWTEVIGKELGETSIGLICLTPENLQSPWIHFEAGALSKHADSASVFVFLFGVKVSEIPSTLSQFQATPWTQERVRKWVSCVNSMQAEHVIRSEAELDTLFSSFWDGIDESVSKIIKAMPDTTSKTSADGVPGNVALEKVLLILQDQQRALNDIRKSIRAKRTPTKSDYINLTAGDVKMIARGMTQVIRESVRVLVEAKGGPSAPTTDGLSWLCSHSVICQGEFDRVIFNLTELFDIESGASNFRRGPSVFNETIEVLEILGCHLPAKSLETEPQQSLTDSPADGLAST